MRNSKKSYIGKIKHTGAQFVKAVFPAEPAPKSEVRRGDDLRTGK